MIILSESYIGQKEMLLKNSSARGFASHWCLQRCELRAAVEMLDALDAVLVQVEAA